MLFELVNNGSYNCCLFYSKSSLFLISEKSFELNRKQAYFLINMYHYVVLELGIIYNVVMEKQSFVNNFD